MAEETYLAMHCRGYDGTYRYYVKHKKTGGIFCRLVCLPQRSYFILWKERIYDHLKRYLFSEDRPVLKHIDLQVEAGETVMLEGPNGCGKSTLIRILNALAFADLGTYEFDGDVIDEKSMKKESFAKAFHQKIGYVFQNPEAQLFCASVEEEIAFAPMQMGLPEEEVKRRVEDRIALFNLGFPAWTARRIISVPEKKRKWRSHQYFP